MAKKNLEPEEGKAEERVGRALAPGMARIIGGGVRAVKPGIPKGIKHPDGTVRNRHLYFTGGNVNPEFTPLGRPITDWRELYFGQSGPMKDASLVATAMENGADDISSIGVYTGLDDEKVERALRYLDKKGWKPSLAR